MRTTEHLGFASFAVRRGWAVLGASLLLVLTATFSPIHGQTMTGTTGANAPLENRQPTLATRYMIATQGIFPDDAGGTPNQTQPPNRAEPFLGEIKAVPFNLVPSGWALCEGQALLIGQNTALFSLLGFNFGGNGTSTFNLPDLRSRTPIGAGQGPGLPVYVLGDVVGIANPILSVANLPVHTHPLSVGQTGPAGSGAPVDNRQPSLALHFLIAANGEIMIVPWARQPSGWTRCDGRLLDSATHGYLFGNIGTAYGGNGSSTFALPDLRGRVVIGDDGGSWPLGLAHGANEIVLTVPDVAAHTHTVTGGSTGATGGAGNSASNFQPSLVVRWVMAFSGFYPTAGNNVNFPMVGEMRLIAGAVASGLPVGQWRPLHGTLYSIGAENTLFSLIGTTFGGDGQSTFAVPDLRARVDAGVNGAGFPLAAMVGLGTLNISVAQLAAHAHSVLQLQITAIQHFGDGSAQLSLAGTIGQTCTVDKSGDLSTWSTLGTVQFTSSTGVITDPNPTQATRRFYKAYYP